MDMLCNKCSEPWDWWYIRDEILIDEDHYQKMKLNGGYYKDGYDDSGYIVTEMPRPYLLETRKPTKQELESEASWQFNPGPTIAQCPACIGKDIERTDNSRIREELSALYSDDIDGFMADMEDFGLE